MKSSKRFLLVTCLFFFCIISLSAQQYVQKKQGDIWGPKEAQYARLGDNVINYITTKKYMSAVLFLNDMLDIDCKNANRLKDYYSLAFCYSRMGEEHCDDALRACSQYFQLKSESESNVIDEYDYNVFDIAGLMSFMYQKKYDNALYFYETALTIATHENNNIEHMAWCNFMIAKCHHVKNNKSTAKDFYKRAIVYACRMYNTTIENAFSKGGDYFLLGDICFDYYACVDDLDDGEYLLCLSAKCNYPDGIEFWNELKSKRPYGKKFRHSKDLFEIE